MKFGQGRINIHRELWLSPEAISWKPCPVAPSREFLSTWIFYGQADPRIIRDFCPVLPVTAHRD